MEPEARGVMSKRKGRRTLKRPMRAKMVTVKRQRRRRIRLRGRAGGAADAEEAGGASVMRLLRLGRLGGWGVRRVLRFGFGGRDFALALIPFQALAAQRPHGAVGIAGHDDQA